MQKIYRFYCPQIFFWFRSTLRRILPYKNKYSQIKEFRDIHKGERCFIIATGPSLTIIDLQKLKNEYTFGMNSLCKVFDELGWETTYYGLQDIKAFRSIKEDFKNNLKETIFFASDNIKVHEELACRTISYPYNLLDHGFNRSCYNTKFSNDIYSVVYDGYTITYSLIQIAVYMGFNEIYLIGADSTYSDDKDKRHFISPGEYDPEYKSAGEKMIFAYSVAKKYADQNGVKIFNATRGGALEVFKRVNLDDVVYKLKKTEV
jgi:hypothetical protein